VHTTCEGALQYVNKSSKQTAATGSVVHTAHYQQPLSLYSSHIQMKSDHNVH